MAKITIKEKDYEYCEDLGEDIFDYILENDYLYVEGKYNETLFLGDLEDLDPQSAIILLKEVAKQFNEAVNSYINELNNN